jgi:hypothetical protein
MLVGVKIPDLFCIVGTKPNDPILLIKGIHIEVSQDHPDNGSLGKQSSKNFLGLFDALGILGNVSAHDDPPPSATLTKKNIQMKN